MRFYIPQNLQQNFQDALNSPLATQFIRNFNSIDIFKAIVPEIDYRAKSGTTIRGQKPMYGDITIPLKLGDYLQSNNGIYIVTMLEVEKFPQCYRLFTDNCNASITVTRFEKAVYDKDGIVITAEGDNPIVSNIYCSLLVSGAQFQISSGSIGIVPVDNIVVQTQFNTSSKNIAIGDNFYWFDSKYQIQNVDYSQVAISGDVGLLSFTGKKVVNNATTI